MHVHSIRQHVKHKLRAVLSYTWPLATALTILSSLEPLLYMSKLAKLAIAYWVDFLEMLWSPILAFLKVDVPIELLEAVTVGLIFLISGIAANPHLRRRMGLTVVEFSGLWLVGAYLFNGIFFFCYSLSRSLAALDTIETNIEIYFLGCAVFAFFLTILLSLQTILTRNIALTIA